LGKGNHLEGKEQKDKNVSGLSHKESWGKEKKRKRTRKKKSRPNCGKGNPRISSVSLNVRKIKEAKVEPRHGKKKKAPART